MSQQQSLRLRRRYQPRFDTLEDRTVPATTVSVAGNTLFILGDVTSQQVIVIDNGGNGNTSATASPGTFNTPNFTAAPTSLTVVAGGVARTFNQDIRNVIINTGTGNARSKSDVVVYFFSQGLQAGGQRNISTTLGGRRGNFQMVFGATNMTVPGGTFMTTQGGIGNDARLSVNVTGTNRSRNFDGSFAAQYRETIDATAAFFVGQRASFFANLTGGSGNDMIGMNVGASSVSPGSSMTLLTDGGAGLDRVFENVTVSNPNTLQTGTNSFTVGSGTVNAVVRGGAGNDVVGLLFTTYSTAEQNSAASGFPAGTTVNQTPLKPNATADGGSGRDIGVITANVQATSIEDLTVI
ncbi:MAG TPA: hypothetical protein VJ739_06055 [Gemmataceae bacterium]|nr:hypothetical protein [Gemmataceae bacterium]